MPRKRVPRKTPDIPSLRQCNGRGVVELAGVRHYLGPRGAPETEKAYRREIAQRLGNGCRPTLRAWEITVVKLAEHTE